MKNSKLLIVLLTVLLVSLTGCNVENDKIKYRNATLKCNDKQLDMVERQYQICSTTGYLESYCYDQARFEHCDTAKKEPKAN